MLTLVIVPRSSELALEMMLKQGRQDLADMELVPSRDGHDFGGSWYLLVSISAHSPYSVSQGLDVLLELPCGLFDRSGVNAFYELG